MPQQAKYGPKGQQVVEKSARHAKVQPYPSTNLFWLFKRVNFTGNDEDDFSGNGSEGFCNEEELRTVSRYDYKRARILAISAMKDELKSERLKQNATLDR